MQKGLEKLRLDNSCRGIPHVILREFYDLLGVDPIEACLDTRSQILQFFDGRVKGRMLVIVRLNNAQSWVVIQCRNILGQSPCKIKVVSKTHCGAELAGKHCAV